MSVTEVTNRVTPLEFLEAVYMNSKLPLNTRLKAATEAAKYVHPRLTAVANFTGTAEDFATELEQRRMTRDRRLVEAKPNGRQVCGPEERTEPTEAETVSAEHLTKGFQTLRRRPL